MCLLWGAVGNLDFVTSLLASTERDYVVRVTEADKAECACGFWQSLAWPALDLPRQGL